MTISDMLKQELDQRGWAQADLARVLSWPVQTVSELRQGKRKIDPQMAVDLQALTGRDAKLWLEQQIDQDLEEIRRETTLSQRVSQIAARAELESIVPVRELIRRGIITSKDPQKQAEQVHTLVGDDPTFGASAKRSADAIPFTRTQTAWIALARQHARTLKVKPFNEQAFANLATEIPRIVINTAAFTKLPEIFADMGVSLVHIKPMPGGRIDGVSMRLDSNHPMIALSGRGKRLDKVLFALLHECAHVLKGHWRQAPRVHEADSEQVVGDPVAEATVNDLATSWVFPHGLNTRGKFLTRQTVSNLATEYHVAPAVVVGHLQHNHILEWSSALGRGLPNVEKALQTWP